MRRLIALVLWLSPITLAYGQQSPLMEPPGAPHIPPSDDFKCIIDASVIISKFGKAVTDQDDYDLKLYSGEQARALLKAINEEPPPTNFKADSLFAVIHRNPDEEARVHGVVLVFLISDGCVTGNMPKMPLEGWAKAIHDALGDES